MDDKGTAVTWLVTVPPNATAHLPLPTSQQDKFTLEGKALSSNKNLRLISTADGTGTYELPAGTYSFRVNTQ